jgi:hypothetical protein
VHPLRTVSRTAPTVPGCKGRLAPLHSTSRRKLLRMRRRRSSPWRSSVGRAQDKLGAIDPEDHIRRLFKAFDVRCKCSSTLAPIVHEWSCVPSSWWCRCQTRWACRGQTMLGVPRTPGLCPRHA